MIAWVRAEGVTRDRIEEKKAKLDKAGLRYAMFKLINQKCSSSKLGPCEICHKPVSEVYHLFNESGRVSLFGHHDCLKNKNGGVNHA